MAATTTPIIEHFQALFAKRESRPEPNWLAQRRAQALEQFTQLGFPTVHDEEWRHTNLAPMSKISFRLAEPQTLDAAQLTPHLLDMRGPRLVFVDGHYAPQLSSLPDDLPAGLTLGPLSASWESEEGPVGQHLGRYAPEQTEALAALNGALMQDGAFVHLKRSTVLEQPLLFVYLTTGGETPAISFPRNLIVAEAGSQLRLVEHYVGLTDHVYATNAVTEIVAGDDAVVERYKIQREGGAAFHLGTLAVHEGRSGNVSNLAITFGSALMRDDIHYHLMGEGCHGEMNGVYFGRGRQLLDTHTAIQHATPHCTSHELYKGILDERAQGVFRGYIHVWPDAQKTDAIQTNQTLMLSPDARINSKPQLEIYADDVKCTHGATIGKLDDVMRFYCHTRGIDPHEAQGLLILAFAGELLEQVKIDPLRESLETMLRTWLLRDSPQGEE